MVSPNSNSARFFSLDVLRFVSFKTSCFSSFMSAFAFFFLKGAPLGELRLDYFWFGLIEILTLLGSKLFSFLWALPLEAKLFF